MGKAFKITPYNFLNDWGEFEDWENGDSSAPTGWTVSGTPTIAKESTNKKFGNFSLKLTGTAASQKLYRQIPDGADYAGRTFSFGVWVKTSGAGVIITIDDGVGTSNSSAHSGGGDWEFLTVIRQLDPSATKLQVDLNIPNGITAYYDGAILAEGEILYKELDSGNYALSEWKPSVDIDSSQYKIARKQGLYIPEIELRGRPIRIRGNIIGSDYAACRTNFDNLIQYLRSWKKDEEKEIYLYDDRVAEVFLDKFDWAYVAALKMIRYDLEFIASKPSVRFISKYRKKQIISASPTSFSLIHNGNIESYPIISFIADQGVDITSCTLENLTTGESLSFTGTVNTGNTLEIDCEKITVKNNGIDNIENFVGDFLKPVPGTNYLKFTGSLCTIKIDWFDRWL